MGSKRCLLSNRGNPTTSWEESLTTWWLLHPHPVSIFTGCFQMQSQDPPTSSNERNSNETMQRKSVCATIISLTHIFFFFIYCGWQEIRQHMLRGKMPFLNKTSPLRVFSTVLLVNSQWLTFCFLPVKLNFTQQFHREAQCPHCRGLRGQTLFI